MRAGSRFRGARDIALISVAVLAALAGLIWLGLRFADPAPPSQFAIASASKGAPYHQFAERYAKHFQKNAIRFENRESDGSVSNLKALLDPKSGVQAAFVQGGLFSAKDAPDVISIGRITYEPLWVFHHASVTVTRLSDLKGKRVLVGPAGGGTNGLALRMLAANGITAENAILINRPLPDYVDMIDKGEADAGFLVLAAEARTIQRLLVAENVRLKSFTNADAYTQKFPFLTRLELREGVVDLGKRIPPADTTLIATTTAVLVRGDAHPALVNLLAQAVQETHAPQSHDAQGQATLFQRAGLFPTSVDPEFAMAEEARRVYRAGPPFLQRYLPFWLATMIDRLILSLVVVLPLLIPLFKLGPQLYKWRIRRRIIYWYGTLKDLEARAKTASPAQLPAHLAEIDRIEEAVDDIPVPLGFADQLYELRQNVDAVRARLASRLGREETAPAGAAR